MKLFSFTAREKRTRRTRRTSDAQGFLSRHPYAAIPLTIATAMWLIVVLLLHVGGDIRYLSISEGQRAPATVVAQVDFESADIAATEFSRQQAGDAIPPVFSINTGPLRSAHRALDLMYDRILSVRAQSESDDQLDLQDIQDIPISAANALRLAPRGEEDRVRNAIRDALQDIWIRGIASATDKDSSFQGVAAIGRIAIRRPDQPVSKPIPISELQSEDDALHSALRIIRRESNSLDIPERVLATLLRPWIQANLLYDHTTTESMRQHAQRNVQQATRTVRAGATLVNQGEVISIQQLEDVRAHDRRLNELRTQRDHRMAMAGRSGLLLFALIICGGLLQIVKPAVARSPKLLFLLLILSLLTIAPAKGLLYWSMSSEWMASQYIEFMIPLALAPLLGTLLVAPGTAVVLGIWTSFVVAVLFDNSFPIFVNGLLVTVIVARAAHHLRRRSQIIRAGLWIGIAQMLFSVTLSVLEQNPIQLVLAQAGAAFATGLLTALLSLIILPFMESLFDITTDITLLELSDMGHPLLQRLAIEAPGSYHHSLMVANLAQAAASEIGANALLVRVCAYFHDIGKLTKPEFFVENTQYRENPHDDLAPSMSTLVIISHVKEGVSMALRNKLPLPIIDGIQQHHGNSLVAYFYHRAKTRAAAESDGRDIQEEDFRYPGPTPQTPEMGILLLADSVEAASRSMEKPTPSRIEHLVSEIVDARMQDNQLDECDMTFAQLKAVKRSFVFSLTNMLHGRVPYPKNENRNQPAPAKVLPGPGLPSDLPSMDYATGSETRSI